MSTASQVQSAIDSVPAPTDAVGLTRAAWAFTGVGLLMSAAAMFMQDGLSRFAFGYLWGFAFLWTLSMGALLFVALHHLTGARWSVVLRRVTESFASLIWLVALLFIPVIAFALYGNELQLFPWLDPEVIGASHLIHAKTPYLNIVFFIARAALFFAVWAGFGYFLVTGSLRQDRGEGGVEATLAMRRASTAFVPIFGITVTFASVDWLMSLEPAWFSTIFGVYIFAGMAVSSMAAVTLVTLWFSAQGRMGEQLVRDDHLYYLGVLMFGFTVFWAYIGYSQYMLIWYADMPEETFYIAHRLEGSWLHVSQALAVVRFVIPFLVLLSRRAKTCRRRLALVAALIVFGQILDMYWLIMPPLHGDAPALGLQELGPFALLVGLFLLGLSRFLKQNRNVPVGDPLLGESLCFHL